MTKLKSNRGAVKRFRRRAESIKFRRANRNHILTKHPQKKKRAARAMKAVKKCDELAITRLLRGS